MRMDFNVWGANAKIKYSRYNIFLRQIFIGCKTVNCYLSQSVITSSLWKLSTSNCNKGREKGKFGKRYKELVTHHNALFVGGYGAHDVYIVYHSVYVSGICLGCRYQHRSLGIIGLSDVCSIS